MASRSPSGESLEMSDLPRLGLRTTNSNGSRPSYLGEPSGEGSSSPHIRFREQSYSVRDEFNRGLPSRDQLTGGSSSRSQSLGGPFSRAPFSRDPSSNSPSFHNPPFRGHSFGDPSFNHQPFHNSTPIRPNTFHYPTSIHRNISNRQGKDGPRVLENRREWMNYSDQETSMEVEDHANQIVERMEKDETLMEDSPFAEECRREALRDMPQSLTLKRCVKDKLKRSVTRNSTHKPMALCTRWKYNINILCSKLKNGLKNFSYTFELWYSMLKSIEGHFGSGIATYFKFLRWLFIMNCFVLIPALVFITIPQLFDGDKSENNADFAAIDIVTGEGFFTNTSLFYGFYTKNNISLSSQVPYHIPHAYFFTMLSLYLVMFILFSTSMAKSYRRSFIETKGGLKNDFAHKIFCGWDYQIATEEAAELQCLSIYNELKDLLIALHQPKKKRTCLEYFYTIVIQFIVHVLVFSVLAGMGYTIWILLEKHQNEMADAQDGRSGAVVLPAVVINLVIMILPIIFCYIIKYEDYKSAGTALFINLGRIFLLQVIVIGVLMGFWLTGSKNKGCWETHLGQEFYRLIIFDFFFSVLLEALFQLGRFAVHKFVWKNVGLCDFDTARQVLQIIYNQALFWMGFYFSPLLPVVIVIKLWLTWYIRSSSVIYLCRPTSKMWKAASAQTLFFVVSFISLTLIIAVFGYILIEVPSSGCGPFTGYVSKEIINGLLTLSDGNEFWKIVKFITKPGVIAIVLVALAVTVYYQRAKSLAQVSMVGLLREMLIWEAKDKEFLLQHISKVTQGQWQYKLQEGRANVWDPIKMVPRSRDMEDREHMDY